MAASLHSVDFITLFVEDLGRSKSFYQNVFGASTAFEDDDSAVFRLGSIAINLLTVGAARDLITPGSVADNRAGSRFQLTVRVDNADATCEELTRLGVPLLNGPIDRAWGVRTASFTDPSGHIWEIAQDLALSESSRGIAR